MNSGPCVPVLVNASYLPPIVLLLWDMTRGADSYNAQALSQQGLQTSCSVRDTSCALYNLNCSQIYNITLTAYSDLYQDGVKSNTLILNTGGKRFGQPIIDRLECEWLKKGFKKAFLLDCGYGGLGSF